MAKLRAALTGAAVSALAMTAVVPAATASAVGVLPAPASVRGVVSPAVPGAPGTTLVTTDVAGPGTGKAAAPGLSTITVTPASGSPGGTVDLRTFADCGGTEAGTVASAAFAAPVSLALAADGGLYAQARLARNATPGSYAVHEFCGDKQTRSGGPGGPKEVAAGQLKVVGSGPSATVAAAAPKTTAVAALGALDTGGGWGATRADGSGVLGGVRAEGALALTGAAGLGALMLFGRRLRGPARGAGRG